eukprot:gene32630-43606_t
MFDGFIRDHAALTPRAAAILTPARRVTYAAFNADIDRVGAALAGLGIDRRTNVVSIAMDDPVLTYVLTAALARLRIASSPFNDPAAEVRLIQDRPGAGTDSPGPRLITLTAAWIAQVAFEEAGVLGVMSRKSLGVYHYDKRLRSGRLRRAGPARASATSSGRRPLTPRASSKSPN